MAGAGQALDRLTLANARFEIDNEATGRTVTYRDFNLVFDRAGDAGQRPGWPRPGRPGDGRSRRGRRSGDQPTLALEAHDVSLADLETFDKKPPPLFAEGPIAFKLEFAPCAGRNARDADRAVRHRRGQGAAQQSRRSAVPASTRRRAQSPGTTTRKRLRHRGLLRPRRRDPSERLGLGRASGRGGRRLERAAGIDERPLRARAPRRKAGAAPFDRRRVAASCRSSRASSSTTSPPRARRSTAAIKAEIAPDGPGVSLKLRLDLKPSVTQDAIRLWPQFINPDVRDWASQNMHGGKLEGVMAANWSAADLDAMDHKRAVRARQRARVVRHPRRRRRPSAGPAADDLGRRPRGRSPAMISRSRPISATMDLTPTRRILADNLVFEIPDTSPRAIVDAQARGASERIRRRARRSAQPRALAQAGRAFRSTPRRSRARPRANSRSTSSSARPPSPKTPSSMRQGALSSLTLDKFVGPEKLDQGSLTFAADRNTLTMNGDGQLFGSPAHIDASRAPGDEGSATLTATLDQAARVEARAQPRAGSPGRCRSSSRRRCRAPAPTSRST